MHEFFIYTGRLNRRPYFFRVLALTVVLELIRKLPKAYGIVFTLPENLIVAVILVLGLIFIYFQNIKRLHDLDMSGWYALVFIIPIVNLVFGIYLTFAKGTAGPNSYGDDPLLKYRMPAEPPAA